MLTRRAATTLARRAAFRPAAGVTFSVRQFGSSLLRSEAAKPKIPETERAPAGIKWINEIKTESDLLPPGAPTGTIPTDLEQSTGIDRLEILGKMQGVDIFDMKPLDASRKGTLDNPVMVKSAGPEQYAGCTGVPADSHTVIWLTMTRERPVERCPECGNVLKMEYVGPADSHDHHHDHHEVEEPKTFADFIRPEYR